MNENILSLIEALKLTPDNIILRKHIIKMLVDGGYNEEAIEHLQYILKTEEDQECKIILAKIYFEQKQYLEAGSLLIKTLDQQPGAEIYKLLAQINLELNQRQKALEYYQKAIDLDSKYRDESFEATLGMFNIPNAKTDELKIKNLNVGKEVYELEDNYAESTGINFDDVGGLEKLKEDIRMNIIYPLKNPELFIPYGKNVGGGIMLYGPPGCGKTFIAKATAGECNIPFIYLAINEILNMFIGESEKNLNEYFNLARRKAPAIMFIDEIDTIGNSRMHSQSRHERSLTNQLLSELDGITSKNEGILVLAATNTPWFVDTALKRTGRFDRTLFVPPPDLKAREEILKIHLKGKPIENIDYLRIAKLTEKFSGADLKGLCNLAIDDVLKEVMKTGQHKPITTNNLVNALKKIKPTTIEWLSTAKNYATYSNQGGYYDDILEYIKKG